MFKSRYNSYDSPQYDTDGSGEIEFPEFCNMMSNKMSQQDDAEMVRWSLLDGDDYDQNLIGTMGFRLN